jgi:hypothetical protein
VGPVGLQVVGTICIRHLCSTSKTIEKIKINFVENYEISWMKDKALISVLDFSGRLVTLLTTEHRAKPEL